MSTSNRHKRLWPQLTPNRPAPAIHPCVIELREMLQSVLAMIFVRALPLRFARDGRAGADSAMNVLCVTKRPLKPPAESEIRDRQMDIELARDVFIDLHFYSEEELRTPPSRLLPTSARDRRRHCRMTYSDENANDCGQADGQRADDALAEPRHWLTGFVLRCGLPLPIMHVHAASRLAIHDNCDFHKHSAGDFLVQPRVCQHRPVFGESASHSAGL